jgi:hypothetical protein
MAVAKRKSRATKDLKKGDTFDEAPSRTTQLWSCIFCVYDVSPLGP